MSLPNVRWHEFFPQFPRVTSHGHGSTYSFSLIRCFNRIFILSQSYLGLELNQLFILELNQIYFTQLIQIRILELNQIILLIFKTNQNIGT